MGYQPCRCVIFSDGIMYAALYHTIRCSQIVVSYTKGNSVSVVQNTRSRLMTSRMPRHVTITCCAQIVVSCTKGISVDSLETVNQILTRVLPEALHTRLAYLSGPSFAAEAGHLP